MTYQLGQFASRDHAALSPLGAYTERIQREQINELRYVRTVCELIKA